MNFKDLFDFIKWMILLSAKQIIIVLVVVVIGSQAFVIYKLNGKIERLDEIIIANDTKYSSNIIILQDKINEQEREKYRIIQEAQTYFRDRVEKLEEESRRNFKEVKHIKLK
jgi:hypothetical protein